MHHLPSERHSSLKTIYEVGMVLGVEKDVVRWWPWLHIVGTMFRIYPLDDDNGERFWRVQMCNKTYSRPYSQIVLILWDVCLWLTHAYKPRVLHKYDIAIRYSVVLCNAGYLLLVFVSIRCSEGTPTEAPESFKVLLPPREGKQMVVRYLKSGAIRLP